MAEPKDTEHKLVPSEAPEKDRGVPAGTGTHEPKGSPDSARHESETAGEDK